MSDADEWEDLEPPTKKRSRSPTHNAKATLAVCRKKPRVVATVSVFDLQQKAQARKLRLAQQRRELAAHKPAKPLARTQDDVRSPSFGEQPRSKSARARPAALDP